MLMNFSVENLCWNLCAFHVNELLLEVNISKDRKTPLRDVFKFMAGLKIAFYDLMQSSKST